MASLFKRLQKEGRDALRPDPDEFPGIDWFCLGVYILAGALGITTLFGCIALAQALMSFY